jgi:hypothetical protein
MGLCFSLPECCKGNSNGVLDKAYAAANPGYCKIRPTRYNFPPMDTILCYVMNANKTAPIKGVSPSIKDTTMCVTYYALDPRHNQSTAVPVPVYSAVTERTFWAMKKFPSVYQNLSSCGANYCNVPANMSSKLELPNRKLESQWAQLVSQ